MRILPWSLLPLLLWSTTCSFVAAHEREKDLSDLSQEAKALQQLRGVTTNLQKNRDGTVRLIRFSKPHVTDAHLGVLPAFKRIDYLAIVHPKVTSQGISHVQHLTNLDTLLLSETQADDLSLSYLGNLKKLERLYLESTRISDAGLVHLTQLANLKTLSLNKTDVGDAGVAHLAKLPQLETLDLSDTQVSDEGLRKLATLKNLKHLILARTNVKGLGLEHFVKLNLLDLTGCPVSDPSLDRLHGLKSLKQLQLIRTRITPAGYKAIEAALPQVTIQVDTSVNPPRKFDPRLLADSTPRSKSLSTAGPVLPPAKVRLARGNETPDFQRHVLPLLGRLGCNGRACHGSFQGQGGFRLSMFGYDFRLDHDSLTKAKDARVNVKIPADSLLIYKPTSDDDHEGGKRFEKGGWEHQLLLKWIEGGAQNVSPQAAKFEQLVVEPSEMTFSKPGDTVQLKVLAVWSDGTREDVTCLTRFQSSDDTIAEVSENGLVTAKNKGDTYIISFYDNGISSTEVILPVSDKVDERDLTPSDLGKIDQLVQRKLSRMGIVPAPLCTDEEFLRRVSLDLIGTLPTPVEVREFAANSSKDKRRKKIAELLESPAYVTWWTTRLCDLTGSNAGYLGGTEMAQPVAVQWRTWLKQRVEKNTGWDKIVRGIVLGTNRLPNQSYEQYTLYYSKFTARKNPADYAAPENTMPHYWYRDNQTLPKDKALTFGYTFLGVRLGCAECHKHPYDQWSQDDFQKFTEFFKRIKKGTAPDIRIQNRLARERLGVPIKLNTAALRRQSYLRIAAEGRAIPWFETYIEKSNRPQKAKLLGGLELDLGQLDDPREPLMEWLLQKDNPYFARSFVNRIWANYFNVGIIDPPDDLNLANPPSNKPLLQYLASEFVARGYDMKWLHREITTSETYQRSWRTNPTNRADLRNFSHSIVRRLQAEVVIDAVLQSTAHSFQLKNVKNDVEKRKINQHPRSYQTRAIDYSLLVFGKPLRTTTCDCERRVQPTLLQALYIRNDAELIGLLERTGGWIDELARRHGQELVSEISGKVLVVARPKAETHLPDDQTRKLIDEAYLRVLSRPPEPKERQIGQQHIRQSENTVEGLRNLLWALLNTQEFITNH